MWWNLSHPHILPFIGVAKNAFPGVDAPCMVTPWMEKGNIRQRLDRARENTGDPISLAAVYIWMKQIALGLEYLHSEGITHGDLRGVNILIDDDDAVRLGDFGLSAFSEVSSRRYATVKGGVDAWLPPEILYPQDFGLNNDRQTPAGDIYSFACACIELYTGVSTHGTELHPAGFLRLCSGVCGLVDQDFTMQVK